MTDQYEDYHKEYERFHKKKLEVANHAYHKFLLDKSSILSDDEKKIVKEALLYYMQNTQ